MIGPALFAGTFGLFIGDHAPLHLPGAPWLLAGALLACGWIVGWKFAHARADSHTNSLAP